MTRIVSLLDSKGASHYVAFGDYKPVIGHLNFRLGLRNTLDKIVLGLQGFLPKKKSKDATLSRMISKAQFLFQNKIEGGILFNTGWYKDSLYIGIIQSSDALYFMKMFSQIDEAMFQQHQNNFVTQHFSKSFSVLPIINTVDSLIFWDFIQKSRDIGPEDKIQEKILNHTLDLLDSTQQGKYVPDLFPIDLNTVLKKGNCEQLSLPLKEWADKNMLLLPIIPVHGDMTPWNMIVDQADKITLIDYEHAGWHVAFYDYFHYILQPIALNEQAPSIRDIALHITHLYVGKFLMIYLVDQLYQNLQSLNNGFQDKPLANLIKNKERWIRELLEDG